MTSAINPVKPLKKPEHQSSQHSSNPSKVTTELTAEFNQYQSPLPPPGVMDYYEKIYPGTFERILSMAERNNTTRNDTTKRESEGFLRAISRGQWMCFSICVGILFISGWLTIVEKEILAGSLLSGATLVGIATLIWKFFREKE